MREINIIGYSGHSYLCIEVAHEMGYLLHEYYDSENKKENPYNLNYLGSEMKINNVKNPLFVSIGDNTIRKKIFTYFKQTKNAEFVNLIHSSSNISKFVTMGSNCFVSKNVQINPFTVIGDNVILNTGSIIEHNCIVGSNSHIAPSSVLLGNVTIGEDCFIGANSTIKQGVSIGDNITIGAGSVVTKNILLPGTYIGVPAKLLTK